MHVVNATPGMAQLSHLLGMINPFEAASSLSS
jgi:hypothetical protein